MSSIKKYDYDTCRFIVQPKSEDPRSTSYLKDAHALGLRLIQRITVLDLYFLQGNFSDTDLDTLLTKLLYDPVTHTISWAYCQKDTVSQTASDFEQVIDVTLRPGVTDPVAEQIVRAAQLLGVRSIRAASTGQRFIVSGNNLTESDYHNLSSRLFSNPVIQDYTLGEKIFIFPVSRVTKYSAEVLKVRNLEEEELLALSHDRRAALNLEEMQAIQEYCAEEARDLTDIEFETLAQTWSEHCVHKTFKASINIENESGLQIENMFNETIRAATEKINAPWIRSAFVDNAGVIEFDEDFEISFKVETHNHPSAIEPFGGANTGVGGVIRDVIGVSAKPIAATDVLCFGFQDMNFEDLPGGVLHPRRIFSGVVAGIEDYGNKIGIPTVSGAIWFDPGYMANPLVFCGCVGIAPKNSHPKNPQSGDHVIVIGGRTGRDGLRGATFSSMTMDAQTGEVSGASVQIGAPIVEKGLIDVIVQARDACLYNAITDCGAGGLSSAVGEMSSKLGADVHLERVPLKYADLSPWEIWLSEAQERMVLAVPVENISQLKHFCDRYNVEMTDIGCFIDSGRLAVWFRDEKVLDLDNRFLHDGLPQRQLTAKTKSPEKPAGTVGTSPGQTVDYHQILYRLLAHPNIASKEKVIRVYDHEVQGAAVVRPLVGVNNDAPSDAVVLKPTMSNSERAIVLSAGINPEYGKYDAYQMAVNCIDEAVRNAVAVGADPARIALLDNFCWGDPNRKETMGTLLQATRGCHDGALFYKAPFISGKDSLNNEYLGVDGKRRAIPGTLLISAISIMDTWRQAVTIDLKRVGSLIYLVGEMAPVFGGSHFNLVSDLGLRYKEDGIPALHHRTNLTYISIHKAVQAHLVQSCHDLSEGGLAVAASEMCIGGRLGMDLTIADIDPLRFLFGETTGCFLVEVNPGDKQAFEQVMGAVTLLALGNTTEIQTLRVQTGRQQLIEQDLNALETAWKTAIH